ncbi:hypothetical protein C8T65DRAFT_206357 [Cerioporus squamosus]|nr:hypothetical protein C8T65DRAFT_206357 [Cerioporus squamosus]
MPAPETNIPALFLPAHLRLGATNWKEFKQAIETVCRVAGVEDNLTCGWRAGQWSAEECDEWAERDELCKAIITLNIRDFSSYGVSVGKETYRPGGMGTAGQAPRAEALVRALRVGAALHAAGVDPACGRLLLRRTSHPVGGGNEPREDGVGERPCCPQVRDGVGEQDRRWSSPEVHRLVVSYGAKGFLLSCI